MAKDSKLANKVDKRSTKVKEKRPNVFVRFGRYCKDVVAELKRVTWPSKKELISYTLGRDVITKEDVDAICTPQITNRIFEMIAAIANRKTRQAMDLYEDLLTLKEPPMRILFLIARQFNQILQVKELAGQGMDRGAIASRLKMQPFVVGKVMTQARAFTREQILSYVNLCVDAEESVKTGRLSDRLAVELLIANRY